MLFKKPQLLLRMLVLIVVSLTLMLLTYRRLGRSSVHAVPESADTAAQPLMSAPAVVVPCIVHQSWKSANLPSPRAMRWRSTWLKCLPECQHILWTDSDNRNLVSKHYPWLLKMYDELSSGVQRADLSRYLYLLQYGGIYADIDTVCLRNFRPLLSGLGLVFGGMEGRWISSVNGSYVQNSFMASRPAHPFWIGLLHRIARRWRRRDKGGAEESTGPLVLMAELQQYIDDGQTDLKIFPPGYFNPFSWIANKRPECKTHGAMSDTEESVCINSFTDAYVVQMHSKSWGGGKA